ncbi:MAG: PAS domain S-box protein [Proteobacteria bacterium]|nr:PAS domain S-box protein [Pseudomonadota bacterium]
MITWPISRFWDQLNLMLRLLLTVLLGMAIASLGVAYLTARDTAINVQHELTAKFQQDMEILGVRIAPAFSSDSDDFQLNPEQLKAVLENITYGQEVVHVGFRDTSDGVSVSHDMPMPLYAPFWFSHWCGLDEIKANRGVVIDGQYYGALTLIISPNDAINQAWKRYLKQMQMLLLCFVLVWLCMCWVLRQGLLPLKDLAAANEALGQGDLSTRLTVRGSPELRTSLSNFNKMALRIEAARDELSASEKRFRVLIEEAPDAIVVFDMDLKRFVEANPSAETLFGYNRDELLQTDPRGFYPLEQLDKEEAGERFLEYTEKTLSGEKVTFERTIRRPDGQHRICAVHIVMLPDERRRLIRASLIDITERREVEEKLKIQAQIATNMAEGVYLIRLRDGIIIYTNPEFEKMFGYAPGEMLWKHVSIVNPPTTKTPKETAEEIMAILREEKQWSGEIQNLKKDGTLFWSYATVSVFDHPVDGPVLVAVHTDITERKQAEEALRISEERNRTLLQTAMDGFWMVNSKGRILEVNETYCRMSGRSVQELVGLHIKDIEASETESGIADRIREIKFQGENRFETRHRRKDGSVFDVEISVQYRPMEGGRFVAFLRDITAQKHMEMEQKKLQDQLSQSQKLESVGALAGGVAHDYNNMLGVIIGYTDMALEKVDPGQPLYDDLQEILTAAIRSSEVTRQLLAFARQQTISPRVIDLNETVESMFKMLRRLIGEDIDLSWLPESSLWPVNMDPSQIDQMIANLCINARDAIGGVGKIIIETGTASFDKAYCAENTGFVPGEFAMIALSDDGSGMDQETLDRIFDPFFTTKGVGQGTGLGLATVYGIVKQNNGFINVYSEPGQGTTFRIYLPRYEGMAEQIKQKEASEPAVLGHETILLVEDEPSIIKMAKMMLERLGYTVLAAATPGNAISLSEAHPGEIHLLMTDVVMPEMNGRNLSERIKALRPAIKCLFMSGYTSDLIANRGVLDEGVQFIQKPFSVKDLGIKVRQALMAS